MSSVVISQILLQKFQALGRIVSNVNENQCQRSKFLFNRNVLGGGLAHVRSYSDLKAAAMRYVDELLAACAAKLEIV
ncbi:uncharacterized protein PHALS_07710 [Plasmopara halstedii]|uniref:Uncharacterized protein n=1 Tax=Plasmopara halstedii TaxID=4781 RepID=A0A0P1B5B3_PLAHL|nr:uncharacterized protein PHALS_07710 [Plasmopara halstedii]CEG49977.1 hypothetical protein PHALS_07710 [Plasmopara halstedii]|eukprot:XP_024586346.1 hypothetical protein PHALS_07710 [Plasmopara halstedii]